MAIVPRRRSRRWRNQRAARACSCRDRIIYVEAVERRVVFVLLLSVTGARDGACKFAFAFGADCRDERLGEAARGRGRLSHHCSHLQTAIHRSCDLFWTARWLRLPAWTERRWVLH